MNKHVPPPSTNDMFLGLDFPMQEIVIAQNENVERIKAMQTALRDREATNLKLAAEAVAKSANAMSVLAAATAKRIARLEARRPRA